mgnify:CR=1 FL=1
MKIFLSLIFSFFLLVFQFQLNSPDCFFYQTEFDFPPLTYQIYPIYPSIYAPSALVVEVSSGKILLAKNEREVRPIASLTKIVTAMTVLNSKQNLREELEITEKDLDTLKGSTSHIPNGSVFTRGELLNLTLMSSENRAAICLARNYKGCYYNFVKDMNRLCQALKASDSYFVDPAGLSPMNFSNCIDLFYLARAAYCKEIIRDFSTRDDILFESKRTNFKRYFGNTNSLVIDPKFCVKLSKTGYILESGRCLVLIFEIKGKDLILILLGEKSIAHRNEDAEIVRKWLLDIVK